MTISCPGGGKPRYRWTEQGGKKVRLAFCGSKVMERMIKGHGVKHKWHRKVNNKMRDMGRTDYKKKLIEINKKKAKSHGRVRPITKGAHKYPEVLDTIVHEEMHRGHPKMHEKTVYKKAREMIKRMNHNQKQGHYARYKCR